ncbi:hypothetical protein [Variovorax paradoxus]|uniref:Riboflavin biosynthesis protein RibD n=1 Tax=Variovorax paradoxus TaxID=34073 RepID=A0A679JPT7_VARPD|nr:Riboflavin biosynthesis protein RibD [Variovorax paradoxus]
MSPEDVHYQFSRLAVDKAKLCLSRIAVTNPPPRVGVVLARDSQLLGWYAKSFGGQFFDGDAMVNFEAKPSAHAEQALLEKLDGLDLRGVVAYVTLEPCTKKRGDGLCCADLLVQAGISRVYIGNCDPNPDVGGLAWRTFHAAGIEVCDFPPELRNEARRDNDPFFRKFHFSVRESGEASFDYESNNHTRTLGPSGREFETKWFECGDGSIHGLDYRFNVAIAKNCTSFEQIDDPARWFEDSYYTKTAREGQIIIFRNEMGYALIQIIRVIKKRTGLIANNAELRFRYQLRYSDGAA